MVAGARVVSQWDQVLGEGADGKRWFVPGLSILYYAGNEALLLRSHDMLNMTHVGQTMKAMVAAAAGVSMPPRGPSRDVSLPRPGRTWSQKRPTSRRGRLVVHGAPPGRPSPCPSYRARTPSSGSRSRCRSRSHR